MCGESNRHIVYCNDLVRLAIVQIERAELGLAQARRARQHALQHRPELARRIADDLKDVRRCRFSFQRLREFTLERGIFLFQVDSRRGRPSYGTRPLWCMATLRHCRVSAKWMVYAPFARSVSQQCAVS